MEAALHETERQSQPSVPDTAWLQLLDVLKSPVPNVG